MNIGLDAGGSATRWVLCDETGEAVGRGEVPAISGHLFSAVDTARLHAAALDVTVGGESPSRPPGGRDTSRPT